MTAALELTVARQIGEFDLDVAFTVESGMSVLFGPSGAGKSLTLALIAGLLRPGTGTIAINGHVVTDCARHTYVSTQKRRIGMVFQDGLLLPHRSVIDNVALAVRQARGRRARRAIARSWLERVGAEELAHRRPGSLSGGQRQRVALARGLAGDPALVLLDEPLSALDAALRDHLRGQVAAMLRRFHITALYVTHDQGEAMEIGDRIAVMQGGRIIQLGTAQEIYETPTTRFVAEFVGEMNRLSGRMAARAGLGERDVWFRPEAARLAAPGAGELEGRVTQATFFGAQTRMIVACEGEEISLFAAPAAAAAVGAAVGVEIDAAAVLRFAEE